MIKRFLPVKKLYAYYKNYCSLDNPFMFNKRFFCIKYNRLRWFKQEQSLSLKEFLYYWPALSPEIIKENRFAKETF